MVEGERLKALLAPAQRRVVLCAPFMQARVVETLLSVVADDVMVRIVTRWRAVEVATGVSDLGVFEVANRRPRTELLLLNDLHAKLFVADERCLVGSSESDRRRTRVVGVQQRGTLGVGPQSRTRM